MPARCSDIVSSLRQSSENGVSSQAQGSKRSTWMLECSVTSTCAAWRNSPGPFSCPNGRGQGGGTDASIGLFWIWVIRSIPATDLMMISLG